MLRSLQSRLLFAVGLLAVTAVVAVALALRQGARQEFFRFREIERRSATASGVDRGRAIAQRLDGRCCAPDVLDEAATGLASALAVFVVDEASGRLVGAAGAPMRRLSDVSVTRDGSLLIVTATRRSGARVNSLGLKLIQAGTPLTLAGGAPARLYVVPFTSDEDEDRTTAFLGSLDRRLVVATVGVGMLSLALTWLLARRTVRPIVALRAAARDLGRGDLSRRVRAEGADEVAALGRAFNAMADELERQQAIRRALMHDVAHELRTPLTALRCRAETILDGLAADPERAVGEIRDEAIHLGRLVDDLQELALAEARELRLERAPIPVASCVQSALRAAGLEGDPRVALDLRGDAIVLADAGRLRQIVLNLLTNADRHTPTGGSIAVRAAREGGVVRVEVHNTGSALAPDQVARIFDRFYRTDPSRQRHTGGVGLGLAIVRHLTEAQGGRVHAASDAAGVTVGFLLPAAGDPRDLSSRA